MSSSTDAEVATPASTNQDRDRSALAAAIVFGLFLVVAGLLLVLRLGDHFWFFRDDWEFLTERDASLHDLFEPHSGHLSVGLVLFFRVGYRIFGIDSYVPFQLGVVAMHLGVVVALRALMRRAGVGPWIATLVAGSLALFGSGREDILWAFQFGFTGALAFGLLQLVLADHDGPVGRRDVAAVLAGAAGVLLASPAIICLAVTTGVILVRRGLVPALVQVLPIAIPYLIWAQIEHPVQAPLGDPPLGVLRLWVQHGITSAFRSLGIHGSVALVLALVLALGLLLALIRPLVNAPATTFAPVRWADRQDWLGAAWRLIHAGRALLAPVAVPAGLAIGAVVFMTASGRARWFQGPMGAGASRYLYPYAVLLLPAFAVAVQALLERWRIAGFVALALLLSGVPANIRRFDDPPFGPQYFVREEALIRGSLRLPYSNTVSGDVRPIPDVFMGQGVDMDFLRDAVASGRLDPGSGSIDPTLRNELVLRLSIGQRQPQGYPAQCSWITLPTKLQLARGDQLVLTKPVNLHVVTGDRHAPLGVPFKPSEGSLLTVERPVDVFVESTQAGDTPALCQLP